MSKGPLDVIAVQTSFFFFNWIRLQKLKVARGTERILQHSEVQKVELLQTNISSRPSSFSKSLCFPARGQGPTVSVHSLLISEWPQKALNVPCIQPVLSRTFFLGPCIAQVPRWAFCSCGVPNTALQ